MSEQQNQGEEKKLAFYDRLKEELNKTEKWPLKYMYKFIVPNQEGNEQKVKSAFEGKKYDFHKNFSKSGKYLSLTFITEENSSDDIINRYRSLEGIEGLVAL